MTHQASSLDDRFNRLPQYAARTFVPASADLTRVEEVRDLYQRLQDQPLASVADMKLWLKNRAEMETVLDQTGSVLYIKMSCQTDHGPYAKAYEDFIQNVVPVAEPLSDQLNKKYLEACDRLGWKDPEFDIYTREIRTDAELFRTENVSLHTEIQMLSQEYQKISGAMTITYQGNELTLPQAGKYLEETDRQVREDVWRLISSRRLQDAQKLDDLFDKMRGLRQKVAANAGFANFMDYKFRSMHRFDYTPEDCRKYHASIKQFLVPLWGKVLQRRKRDMRLDVLRPWDASVDALGRPPLKPFQGSPELVRGCQNIFNRIDPELGRQFQDMAGLGLLDLDSRKGKAPGGYQSALSEARKPFIFMNSVGTDDDVRTLLHEGGHAFHTFAAAHHNLPAYRHAPMEFCEVASMTMELFADDFLGEFYGEEDRKRSVRDHLEGIVYVLIWVAIVDAFQQWIYLHPDHTQQDRQKKWVDLQEEFGTGHVDWRGLERERAYLWHRQLHIFEVPFYYIEYGIAQLGALQLWLKSRSDFKGAVQSYRQALSLGGSQPLPKLFAAAGIPFDFSSRAIGPLADVLGREIE